MGDLRVSAALGLTLPIPGVAYGMVKPEVRLDGIDPAGDVSAQVAEGLAVAKVVTEAILAQLGEDLVALTPPDRVQELEAQLTATTRRLNDLVERLNRRLGDEAAALSRPRVHDK